MRGMDRVTIGKPIRGVDAYILDEHLQPVPSGSAGELYIGGPAVGRGYLHRPELTRDRFLRDPFNLMENARMYKTGDVVRLLADGNLHYLGRADNQVKIRGFRIEIEEIEATIHRFENIRGVAVRVVEVAEGDLRLWAYIVPAGELPVEKLRAFLRRTLPPYMMPSEFFVIEALPLTPSSKVDRHALASLPATPAGHRKNVEPRSQLESKLLGIWHSIFCMKAIGVTDNFFDLGGHSLLASRLFHAVEKECGQRISVSAMVEYPTVAELAHYMECRNSGLPDKVLVQIQTGGALPPIFAIHGLGGSFLPFRELAAALGADQPVYGLQLPDAPDSGSRRVAVEDLAALYASEIDSVYPTGPVNVCGHSWGGIVAFELARQLTAQGRQVGSLALLDTDLQLLKGSPGRRVAALSCSNWRSKLNELSPRTVRNGFNRRYQMLKFAFRLTLLHHAQSRPGGSRTFSQEELLAMSAQEYNPGIYPGRALLILANDEPGRWKAEPGLGWAEKIGGDFRVVGVPGTHLAIFEQPGLSAMAKEFKWHLQQG
jgi:thioesterase domain-containing protein